MKGHHWLLSAIEGADEGMLRNIEAIIKFEKGEGLPYTADATAMDELRMAWKQRMETVMNEVPSDVPAAK